MSIDSIEFEQWNKVKKIMLNNLKEDRISLGPYFSFIIRKTPRRLLFVLSYYKFAAKLLGENKNILEVGCSEGLGTVLLGEFAKSILAIDIDKNAIDEANRTFSSEKIKFQQTDFIGTKLGLFDGIVSFDVIEHIYPENEKAFFSSVQNNLKKNGLLILGTPNETSNIYASEHTKLGHINLYSSERLKQTLEQYFDHVFIFSANDEIVHTGFYPMAHYLIGVGINLKEIKDS